MNDKVTEIKNKCYEITRKLALAGDDSTDVTDFCNWFMTLSKKEQEHAAGVFIVFEQYCFGRITLDEAKRLYDEEVKEYGKKNDNNADPEMG